MTFTPETLNTALTGLPTPAAYQVAFSGGLDSTVLLHALAALRDRLAVPVGAVHVHHGLQPEADAWTDHCRAVCADLDVPLACLRVDARHATGESPEAAARAARYSALADWLAPDHCLLTAQHRDDQAETLLLQLLRGAGVQGLAAMPAASAFGAGMHLRPLLDVSRDDLEAYAESCGLAWVEDPSNNETAYDRNYLRRDILPLLKARWPSVSTTLARSAAHAAEAAGLLDRLAGDDAVPGGRPGTLSVTGLQALPAGRQRNALRAWMKAQGGAVPSTAVLARVQHDALSARVDAAPCVRWGAHEVRRYRDELFVLRGDSGPPAVDGQRWHMEQPLALPACGVLTATRETGLGLRCTAVSDAGVQLRWRQGGEQCRPAGRGHRHALKKLFQEAGIPPWERDRIPLLYIDDELAAVADLWVCEPFGAGPGEPGYRIRWTQG